MIFKKKSTRTDCNLVEVSSILRTYHVTSYHNTLLPRKHWCGWLMWVRRTADTTLPPYRSTVHSLQQRSTWHMFFSLFQIKTHYRNRFCCKEKPSFTATSLPSSSMRRREEIILEVMEKSCQIAVRWIKCLCFFAYVLLWSRNRLCKVGDILTPSRCFSSFIF